MAEFDFLAGGGEMGQRMRAHDWSSSGLGPPDKWPQALRTVVRLILNTRHPMYIWWGPASACLYNDAYRPSIGVERHPASLGQPAREVWSEIWDAIGPQIEQVMSGGNATWHENEFLPITRNGKREDVYWTYSYSPIDDETATGGVGGVLVVCNETTGHVLSERRALEERERFAELFQQAPTFMAVFRGPRHEIELVNPGYLLLIGQRDVVGKAACEAVPDAAEQGYVALLDRVYSSGQPFAANGAKYAVQVTPGGPISERYVDFVYQPIKDAAGIVSGVFVEGVDVTDRHRAGVRRDTLVLLTEEIRDLDDPTDVAFVAARILGETLRVTRVGYGTIDPEAEILSVERDWSAPGIDSLAGSLRLRDFGSFIDDLKRGDTLALSDITQDSRTARAAEAFKARSVRSFVNVPVIEQERLVAVLYLTHTEVRDWSLEDLALIQEIAERTRAVVERVRGARALRESEARLREANQSLEVKVEARTRELMAAEEALRQAQKMEAVGQLTGGLAHDFNNLLTGITGSLEIMHDRISQGRLAGIERYIDVAQGAAKRAASLTQRLLAFSRRQTLNPRPTDVNQLVGGMEDLIRRTIGPSIVLEVVGAGGLWLTSIDPSQLENALLNLCINARDAMPDGGRLTIETANKWLDEHAAAERDLPPGQYISVCATDTGTGMTPDVIARAFDPFFTTKLLGEGTGLGLSMIYGFVRQSGGQVRIYSELAKGTTMCLYLPRDHKASANATAQGTQADIESVGDGEVVLVIDDEPTIRMLIGELLGEMGYVIIEAADGPAGLRVLRSDARIDLLITDVGLPGGMNGRQVADAARTVRPGLKVLFITGYAENAVIGNGHLEPGMQVLTKPFAIATLSRRVREILES